DSKTCPPINLGPAHFDQASLGGLMLINAMDQFSPDLSVARIVVRGLDAQGHWWTIADHSYAGSERHWLNNDPKKSDDNGPALSIPTLTKWTPAPPPAPANGEEAK